nr:M3 family oligoendopeptidase [uncultured Sellimonas sp.]
MKSFHELTYERPDSDALIEEITRQTEAFRRSRSYEEARQILLDLTKQTGHFGTMSTLASIRNTIDTTDAFYEKEMQFFGEAEPKIDVAMKGFYEALADSAFAESFEKEYGALYLRRIRTKIRLTEEKNVENLVQENRLIQEYVKESAKPTTQFRGEQVNFYGLLKFMQSTDRETRREAFQAWADLYESIADRLDAIYSEMIEVRCRMARTLGFSDYVEMSYLRMERFDYGRNEVAAFREQIRRELVPLCQRLFEEQKERLGLSDFHYYDEGLIYPEGNPMPEGTAGELLEKAGRMYRELSKETGAFFDFMLRYGLFDLETKPGKQQGGYCTMLEDEKAPFIFSNFNGTRQDVDVLTHEAGHAFESYTASRQGLLGDQYFSTAEINEIHSMSMEFFTEPWMELFFGKDADKYRYAHLVSALEAVPYMVCVDAFQHRVYEDHLTDPMERRTVWRELEKEYLPWRDYDGNEFLEQGGFWMQKQHIFMYPFYYIDYALAQFGALEYKVRMQEDREGAWQDYCRLCRAGGSRGYLELLQTGHLHSPFEDGTVRGILEKLKI